METEEREKRLAERFAELAGGALPVADEAPEVQDAADAVFAIRGAMGEGPELNPAFSQALRARLVREAARRGTVDAGQPDSGRSARPDAAPARGRVFGMPRKKWLQYAVAASFFIFFLPSLFLLRDIQVKYKMAMVEKYDKMYVPYTKQLDKKDYLEKKLEPFGGTRRLVREKRMSSELKESRAEDFFSKYRPKKRR